MDIDCPPAALAADDGEEGVTPCPPIALVALPTPTLILGVVAASKARCEGYTIA